MEDEGRDMEDAWEEATVAGREDMQLVPAETVYALNVATESLMRLDNHATR